MAAGVVLIVAAVVVVHGAHSSLPPKFIKASYGVQKALYAKNFGYSLVPIPSRILVQAHPPKRLPIVGDIPVLSSRQGRAYKYYRPRGPSRRRRKRPPTKRRRPPYGLPSYATKYKNYIPSRRPPPPYSRYKKKRRPYRGPVRRPPPYRDEFDEYEQEIPDEYDEYDHRDGDYSYYEVPSKRLPLEYDKDFVNRHADLYNGGYNNGVPGYNSGVPTRARLKDSLGQYAEPLRTRVHYHTTSQEGHQEPQKEEGSQEALWPGEVSSVQDGSWQEGQKQAGSGGWQEEAQSHHSKAYDWLSHRSPSQPRPPRQDNQWQQVYQPQQSHGAAPHPFQPRPTRPQELRGWTTSLRPRPGAAAVGAPSRPVAPRESSDPGGHRVYNWDAASNSYRTVEHDSRPRYQAHYSEADFQYHQGQEAEDRHTDNHNHRSQRAFSEPDIGYGQGMEVEVADDGVAGWKVKK